MQGLYDCNRQKWEVAYFRLTVLRQVCSRNTLYRDWVAAQLAESLPRMYEALGLIPSAMQDEHNDTGL